MSLDSDMNTLSHDLVGTRTSATSAANATVPPRAAIEELPAPTTLGWPHRPAWIEIDLDRLRRNFQLINRDKPPGVRFLSVVKDDAYGHGAYQVLKIALAEGAVSVALSTLEEAVSLRDRGIRAPILLLGQRQESELQWCIAHDLTCCVNDSHTAMKLARLAAATGKRVPVHLKINTGMNRYGVGRDEALPLVEQICSHKSLALEGVLSHFAQSDETDKTFALLQLERFNQFLRGLAERSVSVKYRHLCNSGGFLDLPQAHFDMVRLGIVTFGVYPSSVCRRIPGIEPVMTVRARIAATQKLQPGEHVGYGMRYTAPSPRRIAVLPIGYGDGFPRVRNMGFALIHGYRAPIVGGVAMDATMVDITDIPQAQNWDEAVLMGRQGNDEISVHDIAKLKNTVSYDVLTGWRQRLPRIYLNQPQAP